MGIFAKKKKSKATRTKSTTSSKPTPAKKAKQPEVKQIILSNVDVIISTHNDSNGGHPHVLMDEIDDKNVSVGLTTRPKKGKNHPNYPLAKDPVGGDKQSYMRRQATIDNKGNYKNPRSGSMAKKDYDKAKEYADRAKENYIAKKNANKKK